MLVRAHTQHTERFNMSNDTAYLLRMEALKLAQTRAEQRFQMEWARASNNAAVKNEILTEVPQYPTTDEILAEAERLKNFINNK